jgi:hypothetical protein
MKISNFPCKNSLGEPVSSDTFGNNAAISCPCCNHPILFIALDNQKGSSPSHATECKGCKRSFYINVNMESQTIVVHEKEDKGKGSGLTNGDFADSHRRNSLQSSGRL